MRASAGANSFHRRATLERDLKAAREREKREGEAQDERGDTARERAAQKRAAREQRLEQALEELQDVETRGAHSHHTKEELADPRRELPSSSTDPEARLMTMVAGEQRPEYNAELPIDTQSRIIVGVELVKVPDQGQMGPTLEQLHGRTGRYPGEHLLDKGFATKWHIESAFRKGVTVYAPLLKGKPEGPHPSWPREEDGPVCVPGASA